MSTRIRVLQSYNRQAEGQLIAEAGAVIQGLTSNPLQASPPMD